MDQFLQNQARRATHAVKTYKYKKLEKDTDAAEKKALRIGAMHPAAVPPPTREKVLSFLVGLHQFSPRLESGGWGLEGGGSQGGREGGKERTRDKDREREKERKSEKWPCSIR